MRDIPNYTMDKLHTHLQTKGNNADPKMSIQVARAKTPVMDNSYWTTEIIREGSNLGDSSVAARRFRPYGRPNRLYNIYVQNGVVKGAFRNYPDILGTGWVEQFTIGSGKSVAIAFDGHWERYRGTWSFVTVEEPYIFWTDTSNRLWCQLWGDNNTRLQLATSVDKIQAIRGWRNRNFNELDQGVIVGYIKNNGKVYYRNYANQEDGIPTWEVERQVEELSSTYKTLNLFITNDYRMGFAAERSDGSIQWVVTERNWAGMAIGYEKMVASISNLTFTPTKIGKYNTLNVESMRVGIDRLLFNAGHRGVSNKFTFVENIDNGDGDWGRLLVVKVGEPILNVSKDDFKLEGVSGLSLSPSGITMVNMFTYVLSFSTGFGFNNAGESATIKYEGVTGTNGDGQSYNNFERTFEPVNLIPVYIPPPTLIDIYDSDEYYEYLYLEFDKDVEGVVLSSPAFTISGNRRIAGEIVVEEISALASTVEGSENIIMLMFGMTNQLNKFEGLEVTVSYDQSIGRIMSTDGGVLESFSETVTLKHSTYTPDPWSPHKFNVGVVDVVFTPSLIDYNSVGFNESIASVGVVDVVFTPKHVSEINP